MVKPIEKFKKIRSLDEVLTRSGQALSAYREQRRGGCQLPSDAEFIRLIDASQFGDGPIIAESLWQKFYRNSGEKFFITFKDPSEAANAFKTIFGGERCDQLIANAQKIVDGRIDLLGYKNLYVGEEIDWHREPVSAKRSPMKHWKEFDDLDTTETGNKKIIWELNRHQHFFTLGAAFWLTGGERFAQTFVRHISSWMEQNPPGMGINWSSSLEVSFRAMSWIWAFHFFRNSEHFTPEIFKQALKHLYRHGRHIEKYFSKYYSPNTHLTGEALGLYYLGTQLSLFERAKHWRKLGEDILLAEITKQVTPDGVYFEQSTWYQRYTADIFAQFAILKELYRDPYYNDNTAKFENRLQAVFDFLMHITLPDGRTPIIGDDDGGRMLPLTNAPPDDFRGTLSVGAAIFGRGDQKLVSGKPGEEIFWLKGPVGIRSYNAIQTSEPNAPSKEFADGGYYTLRDGWLETDNYMIVDCGDVGSLAGGHGHADALSIELALRGKTLLVDSGTYTYHESRELRDHFRSTTAHNTLVVDRLSSSSPGNAFSWKTRAEAKKIRWIAEERFDIFEGSHNGYERLKAPATHIRSIFFLKNDYWIMRDLVETKGTHEYSLNFHYAPGVSVSIGSDSGWIGNDDHRLFTFGDNGSWQQKESWISNNHGNKVNAPFLRFMSSGQGTQEFFTFILPVQSGIAPPQVSESIMAGARAFVINFAGYTDVFVFNDNPGHRVKNAIFDSDFRYSWARLSKGELVPDEFVLIDGSQFIVRDQTIINSALTYAAVRRLGSDLYVKTENERRIVSIGLVERRFRNRRQADKDRRQSF